MSLTVENKERISQSRNVKKSAATQPKNTVTYSKAEKNKKTNSDVECYKDCIKICEEDKKILVEKLKTGKFSAVDKQYATEAKHPIAMRIGYAGMAMSGIGMSASILGFMQPHVVVGGMAVAAVGATIAGIAKGMIVNGDVKNTTKKDIQNYIQSEINQIDKKIAEYKQKIKQLEEK